MKIFHEGIPITHLSGTGRNPPGGFWTRLVGINIVQTQGWVSVEPIYMPVFRISAWRRYVIIEIGWSQPWLNIALQWAWPPIQLQRIPKEVVYDE